MDFDGDETDREVTDDEAISDHDLEGLPVPQLTTYFLDDDPDRLLTTKEELLRVQGQMEEFVNGMMKYQVDFAGLR